MPVSATTSCSWSAKRRRVLETQLEKRQTEERETHFHVFLLASCRILPRFGAAFCAIVAVSGLVKSVVCVTARMRRLVAALR